MLKFVGKFRDLKPLGYTFQKLYAMDYKTYRKKYVLIWVSHREVMINHLSRFNSAHIAKLILENKYPVYPKDVWYGKNLFFKKGEPRPCMLDRQTGKVVAHKDFMRADGFNFEYDYERYHEFIFYKALLAAVRELHEHKMIEIIL